LGAALQRWHQVLLSGASGQFGADSGGTSTMKAAKRYVDGMAPHPFAMEGRSSRVDALEVGPWTHRAMGEEWLCEALHNVKNDLQVISRLL